MNRDELLADLDAATKAGDLELARAIDGKLSALGKSSVPPKKRSGVFDFFVPPSIYDQGTGEWFGPEAIAADPLTRFAVGAARPLIGGAQLAGRALGISGADVPAEYLKRTEQIGSEARGGASNVMGFAGEVLNPVGLKAGKMIPLAKSAPMRAGASAATGGVYGGMSPVTDDLSSYWEQKAAQAGTGAVTGGLISAGIDASKWVGRSAKEILTTLFGKNRGENLAKDYVNEIVGRDNLQKLVQTVEREIGKQPVPGYVPTTGQMVGSRAPAEASPWLAIEKSVSSTGREVPGTGYVPSVETGRRLGQQNEAMRTAVQSVGGTPEQLTAAIGRRQADAAQKYGAAFADRAKADEQLLNIASSPYFERAYALSGRMREEASRRGTPDTIVRDLHLVKQQLDEMIRKSGDKGLPASERVAVKGLRDEVVNWLDQSGPYKAAREAYKAQSIPINRMQVGQKLEQQLFSPLDQLTPGSFARSMRDEAATIKNVMGQPRMGMNQIFDAPKLQTLQSVGGAIDDRIAAARPLQPTMVGGRNIAESSTEGLLPSVLSRPVVIARWMINRANSEKGLLERDIDHALSMWSLNPKSFVDALKEMPQSESRKVLDAIRRRAPQAAVSIGAVGTTGLLEP